MAMESLIESGSSGTSDIILEENLCRALIEDFPLFLAVIGPDGRILLMNEAVLSAIGRTKDEVVDKEYLTSSTISILNAADKALYCAKSQGRDRVVMAVDHDI